MTKTTDKTASKTPTEAKKPRAKKNAGKAAPKNEGKVVEPEPGTLGGYISHWTKFEESKKGKSRETALDTILEAAKEELTVKEFEELENTICPERVEKREKNAGRAKKGEGLSRADWRAAKFIEAEEKGIWYPGYEEGCTECGTTERKHYSGGRCTRCYTEARNKRLGIDVERAEKKAAREAKKAAILAEVEKKKEEKAKAKLEATRAKEKADKEAKREEAKGKKPAAAKDEPAREDKPKAEKPKAAKKDAA